MIKDYEEKNNSKSNQKSKLLRAKEVCSMYPILTIYCLNDAVKKGLIPILKRGKLNFYDTNDIENYINNLKNNKGR